MLHYAGMAVLYVVATPIGNLEDITLRALRILGEVTLIAAEDTRKTQRLLKHHGLKTPLISYFEHSQKAKVDYLVERLAVGDIALVSEAGMPGISDPGYDLVTAAIRQGHSVSAIPGASAVTSALAVSGLPSDRFCFIGFLPRRSTERRRFLASLATESATLVFFEAPHRLKAALHDIISVLGDRRVAVCRELTKVFEEVFRGTLLEAEIHFDEPRGEFTLVVEGSNSKTPDINSDEVTKIMRQLRRSGESFQSGLSSLAQKTGLTRRELYQLWLKTGQD